MEQSIISSDSHVIEVPDLWEKGMPASLRERAPKAFFDEKRDAWMFGSPEVQIQAVGGLFMAGQQPENLEKFRKAGFAATQAGVIETRGRTCGCQYATVPLKHHEGGLLIGEPTKRRERYISI